MSGPRLVGPARQRFEPRHQAGAEIADRLEGEPEIALVDRPAKRGFHLELGVRQRQRARLIRLDQPARLRSFHRELRVADQRSEEHTSELQSLMRISYAVFCLKKKKKAHRDIPS